MLKKTIVIIIVLLIMIVSLFFMYSNKKDMSDYDFNVYFFNAGKADAILLSKNNKYILIDTGEPSIGVMTCSSKEGCEEKTLEVLNSYNVKYYMTKNGAVSLLSNGEDIIVKQ